MKRTQTMETLDEILDSNAQLIAQLRINIKELERLSTELTNSEFIKKAIKWRLDVIHLRLAALMSLLVSIEEILFRWYRSDD